MSYIEPVILLGTQVQDAEVRSDVGTTASAGESATESEQTTSRFADAFDQAKSHSDETHASQVMKRDESDDEGITVQHSNDIDAPSHSEQTQAQQTFDGSEGDKDTVTHLDVESTGVVPKVDDDSHALVDASQDDFFVQLFNQVSFQPELKQVAKEVNQLLDSQGLRSDNTQALPQAMRSVLTQMSAQELKQLNAVVQQIGKEQGVDPQLLKQLNHDMMQLADKASSPAAKVNDATFMAATTKAAPSWLADASKIELKDGKMVMTASIDTPDSVSTDAKQSAVPSYAAAGLKSASTDAQQWVGVQASNKAQTSASEQKQMRQVDVASQLQKDVKLGVQKPVAGDAQLTQKLPPMDAELVIQKGESAKVVPASTANTSASATASATASAMNIDDVTQANAGDKVLERVSKYQPISAAKELSVADELQGTRTPLSRNGSATHDNSTVQLTSTDSSVKSNVSTAEQGSDALSKIASQATNMVNAEHSEGIRGEGVRAEQMSAVSAKIQHLAQTLLSQAQAVTTPDLNASMEADLVHWQQLQATSQIANQSTASVTKHTVALDPALMQAINITKSDAAQQLHQRVNMMLNLSNQEAEIRLDPPELGSMQVRVRSEGEQAHVNFVVQNQQAKEALEQAMPRLRELLAQQGLALGDTNVEQQGKHQDSDSNQSQFAGHPSGSEDTELSNDEQVLGVHQQNAQSKQGIDFYA